MGEPKKRIILSFKNGMTLELSNHLQEALDVFVKKAQGVVDGLERHREEHRKNVIATNNSPDAIYAFREVEHNLGEWRKGLAYSKELQQDLANLHVKHLLNI